MYTDVYSVYNACYKWDVLHLFHVCMWGYTLLQGKSNLVSVCEQASEVIGELGNGLIWNKRKGEFGGVQMASLHPKCIVAYQKSQQHLKLPPIFGFPILETAGLAPWH